MGETKRLTPWTQVGKGLLLAYVAAYILALIVTTDQAQIWTLDLLNAVGPLAVFALSLLAAYRAKGGQARWFWLLVALSHGAAFFGESVWARYELAGVELPYPSVADVGWIAYYPLILVAVLLMMSFDGTRRLATAAQFLDALMLSIAAGALCWVTIVAPYFEPDDGIAASLTSIGYSGGDVLLLAAIAALWLTPGRGRLPRGLGWLCASLLIMFVADTAYTLLMANGTYQTGSWVDPWWPLAYVLAGIGALAFIGSPVSTSLLPEDGRESVATRTFLRVVAQRSRTALPYFAFPAVSALLIVRFLAQDGGYAGDAATIAVAVIVTALILVRQLLVVVANQKLERSLRRLSSELEIAAVEMLSISSDVVHGATQTAAATNETAVTIEEVQRAALMASHESATLAERTKSAADVAETGRGTVERMVVLVDRIHEQIGVVASAIDHLDEKTHAVRDILATVHDIAEQSNLLAVNAAIEAAKAGEHGKGFGVVAQEVKALAKQSRESVAQIHTILGEIESASSLTLSAARESRSAVESGRRETAESGEAIRLLAEGVAAAAESAMRIAASSSQQSTGMEQIGQALAGINQASEQSVAKTRQAEQEVRRLRDLAADLNRLRVVGSDV